MSTSDNPVSVKEIAIFLDEDEDVTRGLVRFLVAIQALKAVEQEPDPGRKGKTPSRYLFTEKVGTEFAEFIRHRFLTTRVGEKVAEKEQEQAEGA
jgi:hypothetical protein